MCERDAAQAKLRAALEGLKQQKPAAKASSCYSTGSGKLEEEQSLQRAEASAAALLAAISAERAAFQEATSSQKTAHAAALAAAVAAERRALQDMLAAQQLCVAVEACGSETSGTPACIKGRKSVRRCFGGPPGSRDAGRPRAGGSARCDSVHVSFRSQSRQDC